MNLVVLVPAFNEEENIEKTIRSIPQKIMGIDEIKILVVDDGSTDKTMDKAMNGGAYRVVSHTTNTGVGAAFMTGIRNAISMNADILVAVDADSQFDSNQIPELISPILNNQADVVIGSRFKEGKPKNIPRIKYLGNKIFTRIVSSLVQQKFTDTQTGFRAYSKKALLNISVVNDFTYTQEVLIDLKFKGMQITEVPISVRYDDKRKSRVVKNIFNYSSKVLAIITRTLVFHRPMFSFTILAGVSFMMGVFATVVFRRQAHIHTHIERHTGRETQTHTHRERDRGRETQTQTHTHTERHRERDTDTDTHIQRDRHRSIYTERDRQTHT